MKYETSFSFEALTNFDKKYWRIDWFGYLSYDDKNGVRRSQPMVDVFLSKFNEPFSNVKFNSKQATDYENQRKIKVPIEYMVILRLGDVWHQGEYVPSITPRYMQETFKNLDVSPENTASVFASATISPKQYILGYNIHPYHQQAPRTYCEQIMLPDGNIVIVPHYVILQTYFAASSYVFRNLFQFGLELERIFNFDKSYITEDKHAYIHLKKWTHDSAAEQVARIAFDNAGRQAASMVSRNLALQKTNGIRSFAPKTQFPFKGETDLKVQGKWCTISGSLKAFVVFEIFSCTGKFPFVNLEYFRDNPGDKNPDSTHKKSNNDNSGSKKKPKPPKDKDLPLEPEEEPDTSIDDLKLQGRVEPNFLDLNDKPVEKVRQEIHQNTGELRPPPQEEEVNTGNTGEGGNDNGTAPVNFEGLPLPPKKKKLFNTAICRLALFIDCCETLKSKSRVSNLSYITINTGLGQALEKYSFFPLTQTQKGRKSTWQYSNYFQDIKKPKGYKYKFRRVVIARVMINNELIYLFEIERKIQQYVGGWGEHDSFSFFCIKANSTNKLTTYELEEVLLSCSENNGIWSKVEIPDSVIKSFPFKHPKNDSLADSSYVDNTISILEEKLGYYFDK